MDSGGAFILVLIVVVLYFVPSFVAAGRKRNGGVFVLNLFLGWTLIGWVVALAWAVTLERDNDGPAPLNLNPPPALVKMSVLCGGHQTRGDNLQALRARFAREGGGVRISIIAISLLLAGCESMSPYEKAWQAMHLVDVAQTLNGPASDPCYSEQDPITSSLIGEHPDRGEVLAWGIGLSVTHYYLGEWVDNADWPEGAKTLVRSIDIGYKGLTIGNNHEAGIRAFGDNASCEPPPLRMPDAQPWK